MTDPSDEPDDYDADNWLSAGWRKRKEDEEWKDLLRWPYTDFQLFPEREAEKWVQRSAVNWTLVVIAITAAIVIGIPLLAIAVIFLGWPFVLAAYWTTLRPWLAYWWVKAFMFMVFLLIAGGFYFVRVKWRIFYAAGELVVGAGICWAGLSRGDESGLTAALAIAGGVYVLVRGMDNFAVGLLQWQSRRQSEDENSGNG